jgi:hypothetical protein
MQLLFYLILVSPSSSVKQINHTYVSDAHSDPVFEHHKQLVHCFEFLCESNKQTFMASLYARSEPVIFTCAAY